MATPQNITDEYLDELRTNIEKMNKTQQMDILDIIKKNPTIKLNENKGGIFVNMSFLPRDVLESMHKYVNYVKDQEMLLNTAEKQKMDFKNTFFSGGVAIGEIN